ncbi:YfjD family protein [Bacillus sp. JJ1521]|uniref:YfjD family protein n=1 Tax=Bacillus sp. JJ1521 TaxID=3122957 RepID=UPI002FFFBE0B
MENNIKITNDKVEVVYLPLWAGCMVFISGLMTVVSLFILFYIVPNTSILRGFFGIIIGIVGTLFCGGILLKVLSAMLSGKALFTVEDGKLKGRKKAIPISEIKDIYWGGASLKYIKIQTLNNKKVKLSTYNLVNEEPVNHVIETFVIPHANPELKNNWEKRKRK